MTQWKIMINPVFEGEYFQANIQSENGVIIPFDKHDDISKYFHSDDEISFYFGENKLSVPEEITNRLKTYFSFANLFSLDRYFTCHQFAYYLKGIDYTEACKDNTEKVIRTVDLTSRRALESGNLITLEASTGVWVHSAIYLGGGLYLSTYGHNNFRITTLAAMVQSYSKTRFITVNGALFPQKNRNQIKFKTHGMVNRVFNHLSNSSSGLCYALLGIDFNRKRQIQDDMRLIRQAFRKKARSYHPDKASNTDTEFHILHTIYDLLKDPFSYSRYLIRLREGYNWTLAAIMGLTRNDKVDEIITCYQAAVNLLDSTRQKHFINAILQESIYQWALAKKKSVNQPENKSQILVTISPELESHYSSDNPVSYYSSSIQFDNQERQIEFGLHIFCNESTKIGDLRIQVNTPVTSMIFKHDEVISGNLSKNNNDFIQEHCMEIKSLQKAAENVATLQEMFFTKSEKDRNPTSVDLKIDKKILPKPFCFVVCATQSDKVICFAVYLGSELFLIKPNKNDFAIVNSSFLYKKYSIAKILQVVNAGCANDSENIFDSIQATNTITLTHFLQAPVLSIERAEIVKRLLLSFPALDKKPYNFFDFVENTSFSNPVSLVLKQNYPCISWILEVGSIIVFSACDPQLDTEKAKIIGMHIGNNLILTCVNNSLLIMDMLSITETFPGINAISLATKSKKIKTNNKIEYNLVRYLTMRKLKYEEVPEPPLLFALLGIPCNLFQLSHVKNSTIKQCFERRMLEVENNACSEIKKHLLQSAYHLLMNPAFRINYSLRFRTDDAISLEDLMELLMNSSVQSVAAYQSAISLLQEYPQTITQLERSAKFAKISLQDMSSDIKSASNNRTRGNSFFPNSDGKLQKRRISSQNDKNESNYKRAKVEPSTHTKAEKDPALQTTELLITKIENKINDTFGIKCKFLRILFDLLKDKTIELPYETPEETIKNIARQLEKAMLTVKAIPKNTMHKFCPKITFYEESLISLHDKLQKICLSDSMRYSFLHSSHKIPKEPEKAVQDKVISISG